MRTIPDNPRLTRHEDGEGNLIPLAAAEVREAEDGLYSASLLNPPFGEDCVAAIIENGAWVDWAFEGGWAARDLWMLED